MQRKPLVKHMSLSVTDLSLTHTHTHTSRQVSTHGLIKRRMSNILHAFT